MWADGLLQTLILVSLGECQTWDVILEVLPASSGLGFEIIIPNYNRKLSSDVQGIREKDKERGR